VPSFAASAVDADVMAFVREPHRTRIDVPSEFVEPGTGRYTNTSRGALFRLGLAYYW